MKKLMIVLMLLVGFACVVNAQPTKSSAVVDEWAAVAENTTRKGTATDVSGSYSTTVTVSVAATSADAGEGMYLIIKTSNQSSGDDDWMVHVKIKVLIGTANLETITNAPAALGTTVFTVADDAGYEAEGTLLIFIEDQDDVEDSEMMYVISTVTDTSITVQDGSTTAHANTAVLSNLAYRKTFSIPMTAHRVRVDYDNTLDGDGTAPEIHSHATVNKVTSLN